MLRLLIAFGLLAAVLIGPREANAAQLGYNANATSDTPVLYRAAEGGANFHRFIAWWGDIDRPDGYEWGLYDEAYNEALSLGLRPIISLCGCRVPPQNEGEWGKFKRFAQAASARYPIALIEAWNEPNLGGSFWGGGPPQPDEYLRMLRIVSKAAGSERTVPGGLAPIRDETELRWTPAHFIREVGLHKMKYLAGRFDLHLYPENQGCGLPPAEWADSIVASVVPVRVLIGPKERLQIGEVGARRSCGITHEQQAEIAADVVHQLEGMRMVGPIVWFRLREPVETTQPGYGVVDPDGSPFLTWYALQDTIARIEAQRKERK